MGYIGDIPPKMGCFIGVLIRDGGISPPKNPPRMGCVFFRIMVFVHLKMEMVFREIFDRIECDEMGYNLSSGKLT